MKIKKNISVQDRVNFVNFVVNSCEIDGRHSHALFDMMWRAAVITWFVDTESEDVVRIEAMDQDQICDYVYSREAIDIVNDPDIAEVLSGLYEACEKEIKDRRDEYLIVFREMSRNDPLDRVAESFEKIAHAVSEFNNPKTLAEVAKMAGLTGRQQKKKGSTKPKPPIRLEIAKKE